MKFKILIIANPKSGKAKMTKFINKIIENLEKLNYEVITKYTTIENNGKVILENYKEPYDILIICGGDGSLNEAMQAIYKLKKEVPIGFIPMGTTNDFARSLGISFKPLHLSENINSYEAEMTDLGIINGIAFNYIANFGIFAKTSYVTPYKLKNKIGRLAYILYGIREVFNYKTYKLKVKIDDNIIEGDFIFGAISNSKYVGGFNIFKNKNVTLDDRKI